MNEIKSMLKTMVTDSIEINHYLEKVMLETRDSFEIVLIAEQIRKNIETIIELISLHMDYQEQKSNDDTFITTIDLFNLRKRE